MHSRPRTLLISALIGIALPLSAHAEVTIDGSLGGTPGTAIAPGNGFTYNIQASQGQQAGGNLFHSFQAFNIGSGEQANFSGPSNIINIVSRVTGGPSQIAGEITSTISGASLWLINPAGIVMTNGAIIDVGGSVKLTTADYLEFSDGSRFFAALSATSSLSTAEISDFGFLNGGSGKITIESGREVVGTEADQTDNVHINASVITLNKTELFSQEVDIKMGDAGFGQINLRDTELEAVEGGIFFQGGNIYAVDSSITASGRGSRLDLETNSLTLEGDQRGSSIQSGNLEASGGDLNIEATLVRLTHNASLTSNSGAGRTGGDINITGSTIIVEDFSQIQLAAGAGSTAGNLTINADEVLIKDNSTLNTSSRFDGATAGSISIQANERFGIENASTLRAESANSGLGGSVSINAGKVVLRNESVVDIKTTGSGDANLVDIIAVNDLIADEGTIINASSSGVGNGGSVHLAGSSVSLEGTEIIGVADGTGTGGNILIEGETVSISGGTSINVSSLSTSDNAGSAGRVRIDATDLSITENTRFELISNGGGRGGYLEAEATSISLNSVNINVEANGSGDGGQVSMIADNISWNAVGLDASVDGAGQGGELHLEGAIAISDSEINITASGEGNAGDFVALGDSLTISGTGGIQGDSRGIGRGANIRIETGTFTLNGARVSSGARGAGSGGQVSITASNILLEDALLLSEAEGTGTGGSLTLSGTETIELLGESAINVSGAGEASAGKITISTSDLSASDQSGIVLSAGRSINGLPGSGKAGVLDITADSVSFEDNAGIQASVSGSAEGDLIQVSASTVTLEDDARWISDTSGSGKGGRILITSETLNILGRSSLNAEALSTGDAGAIDIDSNTVNVSGGNIITVTKAAGSGGHLNISSGDVNISDDAFLSSDALSSGDGGGLRITATGSINIVGEGTSLEAVARGTGAGGEIDLTAPTILLTDKAALNVSSLASQGGSGTAGRIRLRGENINLETGATLALSTETSGDAGILRIEANDFTMSSARILGETSGTGTGGNLEIEAETITLVNGSLINTSALAQGDSGSIDLVANNIDIEASDIVSDTRLSGLGGDIDLTADFLELRGDALITSSSTGSSNAGDVGLVVSDTLNILQSTLQTTSANAAGGSIDIQTGQVIRIDLSQISASANGVSTGSDGGNVTIDPELFTLRQSQVVAQANAGNGGNISLSAVNFIADTETLISASSQRGIDGTVSIESPNQAVNPVAANLSTGFYNLPDFVATDCAAAALQDRSYLIVENMNPVRRQPNEYLPAIINPYPVSTSGYAVAYPIAYPSTYPVAYELDCSLASEPPHSSDD